MKKVSVDDVNKAFNKYIKDITWVYQGDTSKVNAAFIRQLRLKRNYRIAKCRMATKTNQR